MARSAPFKIPFNALKEAALDQFNFKKAARIIEALYNIGEFSCKYTPDHLKNTASYLIDTLTRNELQDGHTASTGGILVRYEWGVLQIELNIEKTYIDHNCFFYDGSYRKGEYRSKLSTYRNIPHLDSPGIRNKKIACFKPNIPKEYFFV